MINVGEIEERLKKLESKFGKKDWWDKFNIISTFTTSLASVVIAALIFYFTQNFDKQQAKNKEIEINNAIEERKGNFLIATLAARESASVEVKKDMFNILIEKFFDPKNREKYDYNSLTEKIILLESIARNFKNQFEISPLFRYVNHRIVYNKNLNDEQKEELFEQLKKIIRSIAVDEMAQINGSDGVICPFTFPKSPKEKKIIKVYENVNCNGVPLIIERLDKEEDKDKITVRVMDTSYEKNPGAAYENEFEVDYLDTPFIDNSSFKSYTYSIILSDPNDSNKIKFVLFPEYFQNTEINRLRVDKYLQSFRKNAEVIKVDNNSYPQEGMESKESAEVEKGEVEVKVVE